MGGPEERYFDQLRKEPDPVNPDEVTFGTQISVNLALNLLFEACSVDESVLMQMLPQLRNPHPSTRVILVPTNGLKKIRVTIITPDGETTQEISTNQIN